MSVLDDLLEGKKLWDITAPLSNQIVAMRKVRGKIRREHKDHLEDDNASHIDTGVLLGALNLLDGLLKVEK